MAEERSFFQGNEYDWEDCSLLEHCDNLRSRGEVQAVEELLQSKRSFLGERGLPQQEYPTRLSTEEQRPVVPATPMGGSSEAPPTPRPEVVETGNTNAKSNKSMKHKCDTCSQLFDTRIALSIHVGRIHKSDGRDKSHQCPRCPKTFLNSSYLSQHMRTHTGVRPYKCTKCSKQFTQLSHLQQHNRTHTGERPYKCTHPGCTKAFSQLSNLQSHSRNHLPDGNVHKCTSCYKCYYDEKSLNEHLQTHSMSKRERNYKCEECGKSYTQDTYLQNHIKNKHRGSSLDKMSFTAKRPYSIQAVTSMIGKVEDHTATGCARPGVGLVPSLMQGQASAHSLMAAPLSGEQKPPAYHKEFPGENYQRNATVSSQYTGESNQQSSAFKPPPVRLPSTMAPQGMQTSGGVLPQSPHRVVGSGFDASNNNILGRMAPSDLKAIGMERQHEADMLFKFNTFSSHLQQYINSGNGYPQPNYSSYMSTPLQPTSYADKIGSYVDKLASSHLHYEEDAVTDDYFMMGGFREFYD